MRSAATIVALLTLMTFGLIPAHAATRMESEASFDNSRSHKYPSVEVIIYPDQEIGCVREALRNRKAEGNQAEDDKDHTWHAAYENEGPYCGDVSVTEYIPFQSLVARGHIAVSGRSQFSGGCNEAGCYATYRSYPNRVIDFSLRFAGDTEDVPYAFPFGPLPSGVLDPHGNGVGLMHFGTTSGFVHDSKYGKMIVRDTSAYMAMSIWV